MRRRFVYPAQTATQSLGKLRVDVTTAVGLKPITNATINISIPGTNGRTIEQLQTDISGQTPIIEISTPPLEYSLEPSNPQPYAEYSVEVDAPDFNSVLVSDTQVLPNETAIQEIRMRSKEAEVSSVRTLQQQAPTNQPIVIGPHTLFGDFPPKIPEAEIKPPSPSGEIVLQEVVVPEFVIVHDGPPDDPKASNYYVRYKDYIKNVASSEIYATWPESTIQANILAILSFSLNRVFTEWYRSKGKNFTITSSTAYDHKWIYGRNIFRNISQLVDSLFINFLSRPNVKQPILTQYCDGIRVQCPNWMTQWGSKYLGDQGLNPIEILRNFYGNNMFINTAKKVSGIPSSWPGYNLSIGNKDENVRIIQNQLNAISNNYPAIPKIRVDGSFGANTETSVKKFQEVFGLPATGIVDYPTWYKISDIFIAVTRLAELV